MVTDRLGEAARLLRDAETEQYTARARWMLDLARTHAAIAQADATARLVDHLTYWRDKNWATQALLAIAAGEADLAAGRTITMGELRERIDADQEPTREAGVEPATDEDIAYHAAHPGPLSAQRVGELVARVRQEQTRAEKAERERDEAVARADELQGIRWRADASTRKAQERAEAAEAEVARMRPVVEAAVAEVARMRPVVEAAVDWDMAMVDLDDLAVAVAEYRAARKEAGGKSWLPAQEDQS